MLRNRQEIEPFKISIIATFCKCVCVCLVEQWVIDMQPPERKAIKLGMFRVEFKQSFDIVQHTHFPSVIYTVSDAENSRHRYGDVI